MQNIPHDNQFRLQSLATAGTHLYRQPSGSGRDYTIILVVDMSWHLAINMDFHVCSHISFYNFVSVFRGGVATACAPCSGRKKLSLAQTLPVVIFLVTFRQSVLYSSLQTDDAPS